MTLSPIWHTVGVFRDRDLAYLLATEMDPPAESSGPVPPAVATILGKIRYHIKDLIRAMASALLDAEARMFPSETNSTIDRPIAEELKFHELVSSTDKAFPVTREEAQDIAEALNLRPAFLFGPDAQTQADVDPGTDTELDADEGEVRNIRIRMLNDELEIKRGNRKTVIVPLSAYFGRERGEQARMLRSVLENGYLKVPGEKERKTTTILNKKLRKTQTERF